MRYPTVLAAIAAIVLLGVVLARSIFERPAIRPVEAEALREYVGVYAWDPHGFLDVQLWNEITGTDHLVAFDESGEMRALFPTAPDRFFAGPGAGISSAVESRIEFRRDGAGRIAGLIWHREGAAPRAARRADVERREDVAFANGDVRLAGTLIAPAGVGPHPALVLVHGSGPQNRDAILPFARFLTRRGMAVLGYDKRGVGGSSGDWNTASFEDLAGDAVAAAAYLKTRADIDGEQIGLLGVSQAGWIMPLAAVRAPDVAFVISIAGAGIPAGETAIDHAEREMQAGGMRPEVVAQILQVMTLQVAFARTGQGWDEYAAARQALAARLGSPPEIFPGAPDDPYFRFIGPLYSYDPAPTLRRLQVPTLALFGELDNNILPEKNKAAWDAALKAGGHRDYTLRILPRANHAMLEAKLGTNAEMPGLRRFVPEYFTTVDAWLAERIRGFERRAAPLDLHAR